MYSVYLILAELLGVARRQIKPRWAIYLWRFLILKETFFLGICGYDFIIINNGLATLKHLIRSII